jgi:sugar/nucleoside kinase (ribokinase family)
MLAIGEILVDFISDEEYSLLAESPAFHMYLGGQVTNLAFNGALLGGNIALVAKVGDDHFGKFLRQRLQNVGVQTTYLRTTQQVPTTLTVVSRSSTSPDFTVYRGADSQMVPEEMPFELLPQTSLVHTSAFALSREPSSATILSFIMQAHEAGALVSFDPNYHPRLWALDEEPLAVFSRLCPYVFLSKPSLDDCTRLFGPGLAPEAYAARFLELGIKHAVLTLGSGGALLANAAGMTYYKVNQVQVVDVTGAGDAFWAAMLMAVLDGYAIEEAVKVGLALASIKIQQVGPLAKRLDRHALYVEIGLQK